MDNRNYQQTVMKALDTAYAIVRSDLRAGRLEEVNVTAVRAMLVADSSGRPYHSGRMRANVVGLAGEHLSRNAQVAAARRRALQRFLHLD